MGEKENTTIKFKQPGKKLKYILTTVASTSLG